MPAKPFRILITVIVIFLGLGIVWSVFRTAGRQTSPPPREPIPESVAPGEGVDPMRRLLSPADPAEEPSRPPSEEEQLVALRPLVEQSEPTNARQHSLRFLEQESREVTPLGDLDDPNDRARLRLDFSPFGAGVSEITLADHYYTRDRDPENRYRILRPRELANPMEGAWTRRPPLAIRRLFINDVGLDTYREGYDGPQPHHFREIAPGEFEAVVVDEDDQPVLRLHRRFVTGPAEGQITIKQSMRNLTDHPLRVRVEQWGPSDLPYIADGYGDFRRLRFGYLDPRSTLDVLADERDYFFARLDAIHRVVENDDQTLWPNRTSQAENHSLSWVATTNRYFCFIAHRHLPDPEAPVSRVLEEVDTVQLFLTPYSPNVDTLAAYRHLGKRERGTMYVNLKLNSPEFAVAPGAERAFDLAVYAGPLDRALFAREQPYRAFNLRELVVYQLACGWCTFQWLALVLLWFLRFIEGDVWQIGGVPIGLHDWGLAIIVLVLCVRALLHPLTKKGQVSIMRFGKKMQKLQPEMKKLQEKYRDNAKKLQQETMALYREHNVNPAGCLGILPILLQTPIWIALYAMLYFAVELRQQPAFYGFFQLFGDWSFLADLSRPDHLIEFGFTWQFFFWTISGFNILPLLMGALFYFQQKYMTPQTTGLSPEMEAQQRMMRILLPLMMPIFLYSAPSGLTLYILTSSAIGIIESRYIRAHVSALDLEEEPKGKTPSKKPAVKDATPARRKEKRKGRERF